MSFGSPSRPGRTYAWLTFPFVCFGRMETVHCSRIAALDGLEDFT